MKNQMFFIPHKKLWMSSVLINLLKGELRPKTHSCFYGIILMIYGKRPLCKVFWGFNQFSRSSEVTKVWIRCDWRHSHEDTKHFVPVFLCKKNHLWKKNLLRSFMVILTISHELMKLRSFGWLCLDVSDLHVIVAYMLTFGGFSWFHFVLSWEWIILSNSHYFSLRSPLCCLFYVLTILNSTCDDFC